MSATTSVTTGATVTANAETATPDMATPDTLLFFWDYDTQWGADRTRLSPKPAPWGALEFPCTDELLDLHALFDIPACFAVVGAAALPGERPYHDPQQIRRIHAAGHEVASHAFQHEWLPGLDGVALRRTLRESKDALEQCIGAAVQTFVPPFNQPFDYAAGWSFSLAERREAGRGRTDVRRLCEALSETGYRFCRLAYSPLGERLAGWWRGRQAEAERWRTGPLVRIEGVMCVRVGACGFDASRLAAQRLEARGLEGRGLEAQRPEAPRLDARLPDTLRGPIALYAHPHSLHTPGSPQAAPALRETLVAASGWMREGSVRCLRPRDLLAEEAAALERRARGLTSGAAS